MTDPFSSEYKHTCRSSMCLLAAAAVVQYLTMDITELNQKFTGTAVRGSHFV